MLCGACGTENPADKRFCRECGSPLAQGCPSCGSPVEPGSRFCGDCGAVLAAPAGAATTPPPATTAVPTVVPQSERRLCSVLFCDLVGFTPLSESRDPEEVRELLSGYFAAARTVVGRYGGVVEKFIGDAVMAVWGTPVATESDAERAVRAALDLIDTVHQLGAESGAPGLAARAGVVTGEVAVTVGATHEGMVAGDAVNTAARVQSAAGPGQVWVDGATRRLSSGAIGFDDAGQHALKGKAEPEQLWRATRVLSGVGGAQRVDGLEAPLTGRDAEMRTLRELFHAAADRRVPRLVVVSGPPGVGKSRLGWEFEKYVDGLVEQNWWHRGRCLSYGEGVSFWALAEMVRQRLGIAEDDPPETATAKLAQGLAAYVPDLTERAYVGTRLARLLGVPFAGDPGGTLAKEELFAGWRIFFERLAATNPVILLVEDVQHADTGLLDFLDHLVDWARDLPIFVLGFTRPELESVRPGFGTGRNRGLLTLDPLDEASMRPLVEALVPGMPGDARDAIVSQAQGIPLFAVETVRALIDRDIVQPIDGVYRLVGNVGDLDVPDSLHALLAARLDALDPDVRRLVADAAVLGTSFPEEALAGVSGLDPVTVQTMLAELLRREVLTVSADPLSPERGSYRFAQEMLRQVAYDTLSRRDRKARHLTVAAHLRSAFPRDGEEVVDVVARHYLDALAAVPDDPDSDSIRDEAIEALTRAAERAERSGAPGRAADSFVSAARLVESGEGERVRSATLLSRAAGASLAAGDWQASVEHAERSRQQHVELGDTRSAARAESQTGRALHRGGRPTEARQALTRALEVLREAPDADTVAALANLAGVEIFAGAPEADELTTEALLLGIGLGLGDFDLARLFSDRGLWFASNNRDAEAMLFFREAGRLAELSGNAFVLGNALINQADVLMIRDPEGAAELSRQAVDTARLSGDSDQLRIGYANLVLALLATDRWGEADEVLQRLIVTEGVVAGLLLRAASLLDGLRGDVTRARTRMTMLDDDPESEDPQDLTIGALMAAAIAAAEGRPEDSLVEVSTIMRLGVEVLGINDSTVRWGWPIGARAAHDLGDDAAVEELLAYLDDELPGRLAPMLRAERDLARARLAARRAAPDAAERFAAAIESLRLMSTPYHLAQGLLDHAAFLAETGDGPLAALAVAEAREIAERLGCLPVLARADALSTVEV